MSTQNELPPNISTPIENLKKNIEKIIKKDLANLAAEIIENANKKSCENVDGSTTDSDQILIESYREILKKYENYSEKKEKLEILKNIFLEIKKSVKKIIAEIAEIKKDDLTADEKKTLAAVVNEIFEISQIEGAEKILKYNSRADVAKNFECAEIFDFDFLATEIEKIAGRKNLAAIKKIKKLINEKKQLPEFSDFKKEILAEFKKKNSDETAQKNFNLKILELENYYNLLRENAEEKRLAEKSDAEIAAEIKPTAEIADETAQSEPEQLKITHAEADNFRESNPMVSRVFDEYADADGKIFYKNESGDKIEVKNSEQFKEFLKLKFEEAAEEFKKNNKKIAQQSKQPKKPGEKKTKIGKIFSMLDGIMQKKQEVNIGKKTHKFLEAIGIELPELLAIFNDAKISNKEKAFSEKIKTQISGILDEAKDIDFAKMPEIFRALDFENAEDLKKVADLLEEVPEHLRKGKWEKKYLKYLKKGGRENFETWFLNEPKTFMENISLFFQKLFSIFGNFSGIFGDEKKDDENADEEIQEYENKLAQQYFEKAGNLKEEDEKKEELKKSAEKIVNDNFENWKNAGIKISDFCDCTATDENLEKEKAKKYLRENFQNATEMQNFAEKILGANSSENLKFARTQNLKKETLEKISKNEKIIRTETENSEKILKINTDANSENWEKVPQNSDGNLDEQKILEFLEKYRKSNVVDNMPQIQENENLDDGDVEIEMGWDDKTFSELKSEISKKKGSGEKLTETEQILWDAFAADEKGNIQKFLNLLASEKVADEIGTNDNLLGFLNGIESGEIPPKLLQRIAEHELQFEMEESGWWEGFLDGDLKMKIKSAKKNIPAENEWFFFDTFDALDAHLQKNFPLDGEKEN